MPDDARIASIADINAHAIVSPPAPTRTPDLIVTLASELSAVWRLSSSCVAPSRFNEPQVQAADARISAIEELIAASEARTLEGAAIQVMIASHCASKALAVVIGPEDAEYIEGNLRAAERMMHSALAAIMRSAGIDMNRFLIFSYAPDYLWPFPSEPIPTPDPFIADVSAPSRDVRHPDAELIALAEKRAAACAAVDGLDDDSPAYQEVLRALAGTTGPIEEEIGKTPARSLMGISIKLRQLRREIDYCTAEEDNQASRLADALIGELGALLPEIHTVDSAQRA
jgi:hypothetical protein